ncbi:MAG: hypothetical protein U9R14_03210 [Patescibacteria group bacterium]|nr:hypothetical protein [Patescibacteria group bacterium]
MQEILSNENKPNPQEVINNIKEYRIQEIKQLVESYPDAENEKRKSIHRSIKNAIIGLENIEHYELTDEQKEDTIKLIEELKKCKIIF